MFPKFDNKMAGLYRQLINSHMLNRDQLTDIPNKGIYVFYEDGNPLYVGRSDQMAVRLESHCKGGKRAESATFAFILTRNMWGIWKGPYWDGPFPKKKGERDKVRLIQKGTRTKKVQLGRDKLLNDAEILKDFQCQVEKVKSMQVRVVEICDPHTQAMFEVYAAIALNTPYNDFRNH